MSTKGPSRRDIDNQLQQGGFRSSTEVTALSDPIADTPMVVTLEQLRPYDLNPRLTRNPEYNNIKASIRSRGLDTPPTITRRPGEAHYIIRNGGNTRLAILNELWQETRDDRFFRIPCLFKPWTGDISALVGHLAENDIHGQLAFIERALGIAKLKQLHEQAQEAPLSQRDLARRLSEEGYPISQSLISRMFEAIEQLLPALPQALYGGLSRRQVERLVGLRKCARQAWQKYSADEAFAELWLSTLSEFDSPPEEFDIDRIQDELLGRMSQTLGQSYKLLTLDLTQSQRAPAPELPDSSTTPPPKAIPAPPPPLTAPTAQAPAEKLPQRSLPAAPPPAESTSDSECLAPLPVSLDERERQARLDEHIVSPLNITPRVRQIKEQIAREQYGEVLPNFEECAVTAIPVQAGGLAPVSDVWYIEKQIDNPEQLRKQIADLAFELAQYAELHYDAIVKTHEGLGFAIRQEFISAETPRAATINLLLTALLRTHDQADRDDQRLLPGALFGQVLMGVYDIPVLDRPAEDIGLERLPDALLIKLFRLIRLARRLVDLTTSGGYG